MMLPFVFFLFFWSFLSTALDSEKPPNLCYRSKALTFASHYRYKPAVLDAPRHFHTCQCLCFLLQRVFFGCFFIRSFQACFLL